jgi:hypothetical protein
MKHLLKVGVKNDKIQIELRMVRGTPINITLFRFMPVFRGTGIILGISPIFRLNVGNIHELLSVPQNNIMDLNNLMTSKILENTFIKMIDGRTVWRMKLDENPHLTFICRVQVG